MRLRTRVQNDLVGCARLARCVHVLDGYPPHLPDGVKAFLARPEPIEAWVAEDGGRLIGHVALNGTSSHQVMTLASEATGLDPDGLAVVARLLVAPEARRHGCGRALLRQAAGHARTEGRCAVLDVAVHFSAAIALYESSGWTRLGTVTTMFRDGDTLDEHVYVAPPS